MAAKVCLFVEKNNKHYLNVHVCILIFCNVCNYHDRHNNHIFKKFYCKNNAKVLLTLLYLKSHIATCHEIFYQDINGFFYVHCHSEHHIDKQKVENQQIPFFFYKKKKKKKL